MPIRAGFSSNCATMTRTGRLESSIPAAVSMHDTMLSGSERSACWAAVGAGAVVAPEVAAVVGAEVAAPLKSPGALVAAVVPATVGATGGRAERNVLALRAQADASASTSSLA